MWRKRSLATWKGCKALLVIKKPSIRHPGKSYVQATDKKKRQAKKHGDENRQSYRSDGFKRLATNAENATTTRIPNPASRGSTLQECKIQARKGAHSA
ncbi:hypothetical protein AVEN_115322-1 [Araneus ventricosus]|uniref:Uncharacterized protein n=1 Tax=Araneus ventricosus TaxID=182803 RepID=A0A4Y1ZY29_ARAVE|nr:hypothetical protein AVEN_115322-1 [Araneus ventricosus]